MESKNTPAQMTQEELVTAIDRYFYCDSGLNCIAQNLSDMIDTHVEDDAEHWEHITFLAWVLDLAQRQHGEVS